MNSNYSIWVNAAATGYFHPFDFDVFTAWILMCGLPPSIRANAWLSFYYPPFEIDSNSMMVN